MKNITLIGKIQQKANYKKYANAYEWVTEKGIIYIPYPSSYRYGEVIGISDDEIPISQQTINNIWKKYNTSSSISICSNKSYAIIDITLITKFISHTINILYFVDNEIKIYEIVNSNIGFCFCKIHPTKPLFSFGKIVYEFNPTNEQVTDISKTINENIRIDENGRSHNDGLYCVAITENRFILQDDHYKKIAVDIKNKVIIDVIDKGRCTAHTSRYYPKLLFLIESSNQKIYVYKETSEKFKLLYKLNIDPVKSFPIKFNLCAYSVIEISNIITIIDNDTACSFDLPKKCDWTLCRLLWLSKLKNCDNSLLSLLPREIVKEISFYLWKNIYE